MPVPIYLIFIRLIVPLLIFKWPLWGTVLSAFVDSQDWALINFQNPSDYIFYQNWDKAMDIYYLSFAFITTFRWKNNIAQKLAQTLFIYRVIGITLFWFTENRIFIFLFPNIFESFFMFYLLFISLFKKTKFNINHKVMLILIMFLAIPKIINEYFLHILNLQPWQIYNFAQKLGFSSNNESSVNFWTEGLIFYILPFALGLYFVKRINKSK